MPYSPVTFLSRATLSAAVVFSLIGHLNTAHAADRVIVLDSGESELSLIDEATHKVVGTEPTGKEPHHLMITPDGKSLIVADSVSNNLMFIDPHTGKVQRTVEGHRRPVSTRFLAGSQVVRHCRAAHGPRRHLPL